MATFTMTISEIMDGDYNADLSLIGLESYPIFDNGHRPVLNEKIVNRFWLREIGFETDSMFRHYMRARMNEIMPYYNELYRSTMVEYDMFSTMDITSRGEDENEGGIESDNTSEAESKSGSGSKSRAVSSETPQGLLSENGDYATAAQDSVSDTSSDSTSSGVDKSSSTQKGKSTSLNTTSGTQGSKSGLLMEFRQTIINVDVMVMGQLEDLFMQIWSNGDDFSGRPNHYSPFTYQYPFYI